MSDKPLTAKERTSVNLYTNSGSDTYNNWCASYSKAGYATSKGWKANAKKVHDKHYIQAAIAAQRDQVTAKLEHNRDIAINQLTSDRDRLKPAADQGNIQAITARTAITRELNAISNLHSNTVHTDTTEVKPLSADDTAKLQRDAIKLTAAS